MQIQKWKNLLILRNSLSQTSSHSAHHFHSTPVSSAKWKSKWNSDEGRGQRPSKDFGRYTIRHKRADAKKALKDLLSNTTSYKMPFEDEDITWRADKTSNRSVEEDVQPSAKKSAGKNKSRHSSHFGKRQQNASKSKQRKESFFDDYDEHPQTIFQATYGNRSFTWSFRSWNDSCENPTFGFEWKDNSHQTNNKRRVWEPNESDVESDIDEPSVIGSHSDRTVLGLPPTGPLKMEDVKSAFRASALKWHPDKHQGPSQAMAEEKFKLCVDAYKSLCSVVS